MALLGTIIGFFISLAISAIIIFFAAKLLGEKEGFGTAILAALIGAVIFWLATYFLGTGWIASIIGGIAWLIALSSLYKMGLLKSFIVAVVIWIFSAIISWILPTITGPL